ncbi:MAG: methyltransferase family protein [Streptosporangiaceae bacterium]
MAVVLVILVGWVAFWAYWLVVSTTAKPGRTRWTRFAALRVAVIVLVLLLVRLGVFRGHTVTVIHTPWLQGIGLVIFVLGLALAVWARIFIGRNWGMPMSEKVDAQLVTTGPYHVIRHPIYSGILLAMAGTAIAASPYWLVAVALTGAYFVYSAVMEERYMTGIFPDAYPAYRRSTKMLIPFVV